MKRRQLLLGASALGASSLPLSAWARPCPPPTLSAQGGTSASTSCVAPSAGQPAWIDTALAHGWAVGTWAAISGAAPTHGLSATNTAFNVEPAQATTRGNPAAVMDAWCGGAFASRAGTHGKFLAWGGGHDDYFGNEVYGFDVASRSWQRLSEPYAPVVWPVPGGWWPAQGNQVNGSPGVPHTYDMVEYHPGRNSFWTFKSQTLNSPSLAVPRYGEFNLATNVWTPRAQASTGIDGAGWSCYDSRRDAFIVHGDGGGSGLISSYNVATDSFTYANPAGSWGAYLGVTDCSAAYDPVNDIVVLMCPVNNGPMLALNAANLAQDAISLADTGKPAISGGAGFEYCTELGGFIWHRRGSGVYLVTKGSGTWSSATWNWSLLTSGSNSLTPEDTTVNSIYSRFRIARHGPCVVAYTVKRTGRNGGGAVYAFLLSRSAA